MEMRKTKTMINRRLRFHQKERLRVKMIQMMMMGRRWWETLKK